MQYKRWLEIWLDDFVRPTAKPKTCARYKDIALKHIAARIGAYELDELTPLILQRFTVGLLKDGNLVTGRGLAPSSVNGIVTVAQSSLKTAFEVGMTKRYIADKIRRPKLTEKQVCCFSPEEQRKIEQAALCDRRPKLWGIVLCLYTGLRIGELLALEWSDFDFKKATVSVSKSCHDGKRPDGIPARVIDTPKTETSRRLIPLPQQLISLLRVWKKKTGDGFIVSDKRGPSLVRSYQRAFERLLKRLRVERKGFHALRHTFATRAIECGMDVKTLSEILGHKNPTITLTRYAHSLNAHKRDMMNRVGKRLELPGAP